MNANISEENIIADKTVTIQEDLKEKMLETVKGE